MSCMSCMSYGKGFGRIGFRWESTGFPRLDDGSESGLGTLLKCLKIAGVGPRADCGTV
jgi:hypothetical protein